MHGNVCNVFSIHYAKAAAAADENWQILNTPGQLDACVQKNQSAVATGLAGAR